MKSKKISVVTSIAEDEVFGSKGELPFSVCSRLEMLIPNKFGISSDRVEWLDIDSNGDPVFKKIKRELSNFRSKIFIIESRFLKNLVFKKSFFFKIWEKIVGNKKVHIINSENPDFKELEKFLREAA